MEFTQIVPLKRIALSKITIALWNENDAKNLLAGFANPRQKEVLCKWRELENEVIAKVAKLPIPELLKGKIRQLVNPVGFELFVSSSTQPKEVSNTYWTSLGTIDVRSMLQDQVQQESINSNCRRFEIAGYCCFVEDVDRLWKVIPKDPYKNLASLRKNRCISPLLSFWCHFLRRKTAIFDKTRKTNYGDSDMTLYEFLFWFAVKEGNELACRYFLPKLTAEEKERMLVRAAIYVAQKRPAMEGLANFVNILFFLFSVMDEAQQMEVLGRELRSILLCFFEWPWQDLFFTMSQNMWQIFTPGDFFYLLIIIRERIIFQDRDYDYQILFGLVWGKIPTAHKKAVINRCIVRSSFIKFLEMKNETNIKLLLRDAVISIDEIAFNWKGRRLYESLIYYNLWDLFKFFLQECSLSRDNLMKFREQLKKNILAKIGKGKPFVLDKPIEIINQLIQECNKRKSGEENGHHVKKHCSVKREEFKKKQIMKK